MSSIFNFFHRRGVPVECLGMIAQYLSADDLYRLLSIKDAASAEIVESRLQILSPLQRPRVVIQWITKEGEDALDPVIQQTYYTALTRLGISQIPKAIDFAVCIGAGRYADFNTIDQLFRASRLNTHHLKEFALGFVRSFGDQHPEYQRMRDIIKKIGDPFGNVGKAIRIELSIIQSPNS